MRVVVTGRVAPGILPDHDDLSGDLLIDSDFVRGQLDLVLLPEDLDDWENALVRLANGEDVSWMDSGRSPELHIAWRERRGVIKVTVINAPQSGVTVTFGFVPPENWISDHQERLKRVRATWPREVIEPSPLVFEWRSGHPPRR